MTPPTDRDIALGRRAVALGWPPDWTARLPALVRDWRGWAAVARGASYTGPEALERIPDFRDPVTAAAVMPWARERLGDPGAYCAPWGDRWRMHWWPGEGRARWADGPTEIDAWLNAVERRTDERPLHRARRRPRGGARPADVGAVV